MSASRSHFSPRLAEHVRACRVGDQMIFLDLHRSKYVGVGGPRLDALSAALLDGPADDDSPIAPPDPDLLDEWSRHLRHHHLLSDASSAELERKPPRLPDPIAGLTSSDDDGVVASDWRHLVRLWQASFISAQWLRRRSLAEVANRVIALRPHHSIQIDDRSAQAMGAAAASYMRLRPFALSTQDRCLHDSLALIHFLAHRGLFPHWVIGVRVRPFGAHSWVQSGGVVLNDLPEHVRCYEPILVV